MATFITAPSIALLRCRSTAPERLLRSHLVIVDIVVDGRVVEARLERGGFRG